MGKLLPYVPGFVEQLGQALQGSSEAFGSYLGGKIKNARANKQYEEELSRYQQKYGSNQGSGAPINSPLEGIQANAQPQAAQPQPGDPIMIHEPSDIERIVDATRLGQRAEAANKAKAGTVTKNILDNQLLDKKLAAKKSDTIEAEDRSLLHKGKQTFFDKIESDRLKLPDEGFSIDAIEDAVISGEVDPFSSAHIGEIAKSFGAPASLTKVLETPGSKEFKTARKTFIGNIIKDSFRGTTTKIEIQLAEDTIAELGVSKEANLASVAALRSSYAIRQERLRMTDELIANGVSPSKVPATVDKMLQPFIKSEKDEYFKFVKKLRERNKSRGKK